MDIDSIDKTTITPHIKNQIDLNETIEKKFFDIKNDRIYANEFLPYKGGSGDIHTFGHLWPSKYREFYFKHGLLDCLIDILTDGSIKLSHVFKNNESDTLKFIYDFKNINTRQKISKLLDITFKRKHNYSLSEDPEDIKLLTKLNMYIKLQNAFIEGLHQNNLLLKLGSNALEQKVREERKYNKDETNRADLLYDCVYSLLVRSVEIMDNFTTDIIPQISKALDEEDYEHSYEVCKIKANNIKLFFTAYSPRIEGVSLDELEPLRIEPLGIEDKKLVPSQLKDIVDNWKGFDKKTF